MLTLAFSQLVYTIAVNWRDVTGGSDGIAIPEQPSFFGYDLSNSLVMYFMALSFLVVVYAGLRRLLNAPLGHAFVGIRENEPRMIAIGYPTRLANWFHSRSRVRSPALAAGCMPSSTHLIPFIGRHGAIF
jgi:branched-chain amino acid transport system permease protein